MLRSVPTSGSLYDRVLASISHGSGFIKPEGSSVIQTWLRCNFGEDHKMKSGLDGSPEAAKRLPQTPILRTSFDWGEVQTMTPSDRAKLNFAIDKVLPHAP